MKAFLTAAFLLLFAGPAWAQGGRGTITGTISDPVGAMVAGAQIEMENTQTGAAYRTNSTLTGNYTLAQLPAGIYQLSVAMSGFKTFIRRGITVLVGQTLRIDVELEVGQITESVTVSADAPLLQTETGELSHNVNTDRLNELPILGIGASAGSSGIRNPYAVTQLVPGTLYAGNSTVRVNGAPRNTQGFRVEGQDSVNGLWTQTAQQQQPSVDAVEEFQVQTSNYAAEFGQAGGGFFNLTMKSGTNQFHGSAYDYWVNEALNAEQPFINVKPRQRRHNYGFTFGGPVLIPGVYSGHNNTFFFFNFEQYREVVNVNNRPVTVPTLLYRQGDFSQALTGRQLATDPLGRPIMENAIYDPRTSRIVDGKVVRDPFPGNVVPQSLWDPVSTKIQAMIPQPDSSALVDNLTPTYPQDRVTDIPGVKIDHMVSASGKISGYWSRTKTFAKQHWLYGQADGLPSPITQARGTNIKSHTVRLNYDHTLTPTTLLHLGAGVVHLTFKDDVEDTNFDPVKEIGLTGTYATRFPRITISDHPQGGMRTMGPIAQSHIFNTKPTANANVTWVRNNHTIKAGAEMVLEGYPALITGRAVGFFTFGNTETGLPSTQGQRLAGGNVGFPYASFLMGRVGSGSIGLPTKTRLGSNSWGFYVQDTWKVTRKLTLDYGLRYDYQTYLREQYGRMPSFSPTTPNPSAGGIPGGIIFEGSGPGRCNCDFAEVYPYAFGPRLGAAYQVMPRTVLRVGFGISYSKTAQNTFISQNFASREDYSSDTFGDPAHLFRNGVPIVPKWPVFDAGLYPVAGSHTSTGPPIAIDRNAGRPARTIQWSVGVQREISTNLALDVTYVGNRGAWWQANGLISANALSYERLASFGLDPGNADDRALLLSRMNSPLAASRGFNTPPYPGFPMTATVGQSLRPFPQFSNINYSWAPLGRTWYDSLQIKATKRYSYGLDFTAAFTWQK